MSEPPHDSPPSLSPQPVVQPLDYGRPYRPPGQRRDLILGIVISFLMAIGTGCMTFALFKSAGGLRDDDATIAAVGATCLVAAFCLVALMFLLRRAR